MGFDEDRQRVLAERAHLCPDARKALAESLKPIADSIIQAYTERLSQSGLSVEELKAHLLEFPDLALTEALARFRECPSYKIGTYFGWCMRQQVERSLVED